MLSRSTAAPTECVQLYVAIVGKGPSETGVQSRTSISRSSDMNLRMLVVDSTAN